MDWCKGSPGMGLIEKSLGVGPGNEVNIRGLDLGEAQKGTF